MIIAWIITFPSVHTEEFFFFRWMWDRGGKIEAEDDGGSFIWRLEAY